MLLLVWCLEARLTPIGNGRAALTARDWHETRHASGHDLSRLRLLCFGDSLVKTGVLPRLIEARTGLRGHNFAVIGGQAPSSYFLLRQALSSGARPAAIVVDFFPPLLSLDLRQMERTFPELVGMGESLELAWCRGRGDEFLRLASAQTLPAVRLRTELREGVLAALEGKSEDQGCNLVVLRNWRQNAGATVLPPLRCQEDAALWYRTNYPAPWVCHPLNHPFVDRFLELAAAHAVRVYWFLPPVAPEAQRLCEEGGQNARYDAFVRAKLGRFPNLVVVDGRHAGYRAADFADTVHVRGQAAVQISAGLAAVIRQPAHDTAAGQRWVRLPARQETVAAFPVEDVDESARVLKREVIRWR